MNKTFFARYYFVVFIALAALAPVITRGARLAIESNNNNVKDWLPPSYDESRELEWFQKHFPGEEFALVSWDGCTLGDTEKLNLLAKKLSKARSDPDDGDGGYRLFKSVTTGPEMIEQLTESLEISESAAIRRLQGAMVGPRPEGAEDNDARVTCLVAMLSDEATETNRRMRSAIEKIPEVAETDCAIPPAIFRMGGPPVDNVTIDVEGERTLIKLAGCAGVLGLVLAYWCLRSWSLTLFVFGVGVLSAGLSLAIVYYTGVFEVIFLGLSRPDFGTADAILMSMPAVVYVLGLSGAIHIVNYYRDAVEENGRPRAAEKAISDGWLPCTLAAFTTAVGLGSLYLSDITPIKKFGFFTAFGVMGTLILLFTWLPACLHRFPPKLHGLAKRKKTREAGLPRPVRSLFEFIIHRNKWVCGAWAVIVVAVAFGLPRIETSVQLLKLFDPDSDIIHDYAWFETNLGNLVPMEVVLRVPDALQRDGDEDPEASGQHYAQTMAERVEMVRRIRDRMESLPAVGKSLSAADFAPKVDRSSSSLTSTVRHAAINSQLEKHRQELLEGDYLCMENATLTVGKNARADASGQPPAELWRVSARVEALNDVDYGEFIHKLRDTVAPIVDAYHWRNQIVRSLSAEEKKLHLSTVCVLAPPSDVDDDEQEADVKGSLKLLRTLLIEAGAKRVRIRSLPQLPEDAAERDEEIARIRALLAEQDCVVIAPTSGHWTPKQLDQLSDTTVQLSETANGAGEKDTELPKVADVSVVYTGVVPLVYKTQRELLVSLETSIGTAALLIALVMMCVLKSFPAGLVSMIPNLFPIVMVFGGLGWIGQKVEIGIMMCASVALGVAVDDTVHFLYWFRRGMIETGDRKAATMVAYERCARAMTQTTIIGGLGLSVFALSSFTPTQQFGYMMVTMLTAALVGDLLLLPAILAGPVGRFFCGRLAKQHAENSQNGDKQPPSSTVVPPLHLRHDAPHRSVRT